MGGQVFALQDHGSVGGHGGLGLGFLVNGTANHHPDDLGDFGVGGFPDTHVLTVTHNGDPVGDPLQLIHSVGDIDDADAGGLQLAHEGEQIVDLCVRQNGGGLVQDQQLGIVVGKCLGNFHHLLLGNGEGSHHCLGVDAQVQAVQQILGLLVLCSLVQEETGGGFTTDVNIVGNSQMLHQVKLLVNDADASVLCVFGAIDLDLFAEELNGTAVLGIDAGQNLHQCGLTGAVFADQCHNLTAAHFQLCVIQRVNTGEVFLNSLHLQNSFAHSNITFLIHCFPTVREKWGFPGNEAGFSGKSTAFCLYPAERRENESFRATSVTGRHGASCYTIINFTKKIKLFF